MDIPLAQSRALRVNGSNVWRRNGDEEVHKKKGWNFGFGGFVFGFGISLTDCPGSGLSLAQGFLRDCLKLLYCYDGTYPSDFCKEKDDKANHYGLRRREKSRPPTGLPLGLRNSNV